ncbi:MAG TPA: DUF6088 family protein [Terracidiphilus sp.]
MSASASSIPAAIRNRISALAQHRDLIPEDFADLGPRTAVDQALHRLVASRDLRRIARGFYDTPHDNRLTEKPTYPNPRDVIDALTRKGKVRVVVDGLTAANDLGLADAVPARIGVLTDGRLRPITLGNLTLDFRAAAPSRLYWAGRPAMRFVQALHWLRDMLPSDDGSLRKRLISILRDPDHGRAMLDMSRWMSRSVQVLGAAFIAHHLARWVDRHRKNTSSPQPLLRGNRTHHGISLLLRQILRDRHSGINRLSHMRISQSLRTFQPHEPILAATALEYAVWVRQIGAVVEAQPDALHVRGQRHDVVRRPCRR